MSRVYLVVVQDPGLDHLFDYVSAHGTREGAVGYIEGVLRFIPVETLEGDVYHCDPGVVDSSRHYHGFELYDVRHAYPRECELGD